MPVTANVSRFLDGSLNNLELITQCYFLNDPEADESWITNHPGLVIPLAEGIDGLYGNFDIDMDEDGIEIEVDEHQCLVPQEPYLNKNFPKQFKNVL